MDKFDKLSIPEVVTLSFTNGEVCTYEKMNKGNTNQEGPNTQVPMFTWPWYNLADQNLETNFEAMANNYAAQLEALDKQYESASKELLKNYESWKEKLKSRLEGLKVPTKKVETIIQWIRATNVGELLEAAQMLESNAEYIIKKVESPKLIYDVFLSCVQKNSKEITESLQEKGMKVCCDESAGELDIQGTIDGIVDSCSFAIILTTNYFQKPSCIFQYLVSVVAGKLVLPAYELNPRYDGGFLESYELPKMFQHILKGKSLQVNRTYWEAFITSLCTRIKQKSGSLAYNLTPVQRLWLESELKKERLAIGGLLYSSIRDGNTAEAFHTKCDGQGATITTIEDNNGHFFGGFTSRSWSSTGDYSSCKSVWLFTQDPKGSLKRINLKAHGRQHSVYSNKIHGPTFGGGHDVAICPGGQSYCSPYSFGGPVLPCRNFTIKHYQVFKAQ